MPDLQNTVYAVPFSSMPSCRPRCSRSAHRQSHRGARTRGTELSRTPAIRSAERLGGAPSPKAARASCSWSHRRVWPRVPMKTWISQVPSEIYASVQATTCACGWVSARKGDVVCGKFVDRRLPRSQRRSLIEASGHSAVSRPRPHLARRRFHGSAFGAMPVPDAPLCAVPPLREACRPSCGPCPIHAR
jgi:hypothetical protein